MAQEISSYLIKYYLWIPIEVIQMGQIK